MRSLAHSYCAEAQDVRRQVSGLSEAEFARRFRHPFIVWEQPGSGDTFVFGVCKSARNEFKQMVTLGRASNNDIVVREDSISEFHAYLSWNSEMEEHCLTDVGSKNGTSVGRWQVSAHEPNRLTSGDKIRIGRVVLKFFSAVDLYHYLRSVREANHRLS